LLGETDIDKHERICGKYRWTDKNNAILRSVGLEYIACAHAGKDKCLIVAHLFKVKVTSKKHRKSLFLQCKTLIGRNSLSIKQSHEVCLQHEAFGYGESNGVTAVFVT